MVKHGKKIKRLIKGMDERHRALWQYRSMWQELPLCEKCILIESQQGRTPCGNMYYIVKELLENELYSDYDIFFVARQANAAAFRDFFSSRGMQGLKIVELGSRSYLELLATAKYLITDTSFPTYYTKKTGQIVWNTWHGTPLKALGRSDSGSLHKIGNVQKNFFLADFLSYPSEYVKDKIFTDYMLDNLSTATVLFCGYPRNSAFFSTEQIEENKRRYVPTDVERIYAYMPTWRDTQMQIPHRFRGSELMSYLMQIDSRLADNEILYVNLHPLARTTVDFSIFKHVVEFPAELETYEFLACCDVLITDYSSVLFDFAVTRKKIVLFSYDVDLYLQDRGLYLRYDDLPFPKVSDVASLMDEVRSDGYVVDEGFIGKYCAHDCLDSAKLLCSRVILGNAGQISEKINTPNGKKNVLIYSGNLAKNGITSSLTNLISNLDLSENNYYLTFNASHVAKNKDYLAQLPRGISYIPCMGKAIFSPKEKAIQYLYAERKISFKRFDETLSQGYKLDIKRLYGDIEFNVAIQFSGYDYKKVYQFSQFPCKRIIFAHSDMLAEAESRGNVRLDLMNYAYSTYDEVAVVSEGLSDSIKKISQNRASISFVPNLFDYRRVMELSKEALCFDSETESNKSLDEITEFFSRGRVLVSVGRFSPEKQHDILLDAFDQIAQSVPDLYLLIIGGSSWRDYYSKTVEHARSLKTSSRVGLIKGLSNPYPFIAKSAGLILPSRYEGFGLVLLEADVLGKPVVSTDIAGPRAFMKSHGGCLVENSKEGVAAGVSMLERGAVKVMNVDYEKYNHDALNSFFGLLRN